MINLERMIRIQKNNSGIILLAVCWIMAILTVLVIGLGRQARVEIAMTKHAIGKLKAKYIAMAGLMYAVQQIRLDTEDDESRQYDSLAYCGIRKKEGFDAQEIFSHVDVGEGYFKVGYLKENFDEQPLVEVIGLADEERKISLNSITVQTKDVFERLIIQEGFDEEVAQTIAFSVIDWKDQDKDPAHPQYGAEDDYYLAQSAPLHCKNSQFESIEELLLIRGMTQEIFNRIKGDLAIFPKQQQLKINFDTASAKVLNAVALAYTGARTNTTEDDALRLVDKMLIYRRGDDEIEGTEDDQIIDFQDMPLTAKERALALTINNKHRTKQSNYLRVMVTGVDKQSQVSARIEAIVQRSDLKIKYWRRN